MYDIIIKDSKILDGTGIPGFRGNIGIKAEKMRIAGDNLYG